MVRLILTFVAAFVLALGGASGVVIMRAKKTAAVAADSTKAATPVKPVVTVDTVKPPAHDTAKAQAPATKPATTVAVDTAKATPAAKPAPTPTKPALIVPTVPSPALVVGGRMSKIFTAMPIKEAAKVLDQMDDADIVTILSAVNDRKAGELLALLPTARAATISKSVLKRTAAVK